MDSAEGPEKVPQGPFPWFLLFSALVAACCHMICLLLPRLLSLPGQGRSFVPHLCSSNQAPEAYLLNE